MTLRTLPFSADPRLALYRMVNLLKVAGEPTRMRLLTLLGHGDLTVSDMTSVLGQSQPRVSRHLRLLVEARLIERHQEGAWAYFRLARSDAALAIKPVLDQLDPNDADLARDRKRLDTVRAEHAAAASDYFAANAADWDRIRALHAPDEAVERAMLELIGDTPIQSMLDLGTGTGRMLEVFASLVREGLGLDTSREMLAIARNKLRVEGLSHLRVQRANILAADVPGERFDLVTMHQVLHFLDAPQRAIREAKRVLAPGGRLLIADFAPHNHEFLREEQAHRRLGFAPETVVDWLQGIGLSIEAIRELPSDDGDGLTVVLWLARDPRRVMA